ncbi:hypothetical protein HNR42_001968 [Deinobacterium chartae]|uniref:Uncharacterized protein n=1 Tax=Deinobacterium chartae TaxID=521158 RepID=A0A841I0N1_9DEIO|nr:hypothetical protein [Deinobacterium chartae]MBB6098534.1 hypothetical protein [Deinobacterium chartae]
MNASALTPKLPVLDRVRSGAIYEVHTRIGETWDVLFNGYEWLWTRRSGGEVLLGAREDLEVWLAQHCETTLP